VDNYITASDMNDPSRQSEDEFEDDPHNQLSFDAPAIFRQLQIVVSETDAAYIGRAYALSALSGGLNEWPVIREAGASHNPKPARLLHILLNEGKVKDREILCAAVLACATRLTAKQGIDFGMAYSLAERSLEVQAEEAIVSLKTDHRLAYLYLARKLDEIRHLHMTILSRAERKKTVDQLALKVIPELQKQPNTCEGLKRLLELVSAAAERFNRTHGF